MINEYERHNTIILKDEFHDAVESFNEIVKFQFEFSAPKICLQLSTTLKDGQEWELITYLENMNVVLQQNEHDLRVQMKVQSLMIKDNSNDERFPFIFKNMPLEG